MNSTSSNSPKPIYSAWRLGRLWRPSPLASCRRSLLHILALAHQSQTKSASLSLTTLLSLYAQEESRRYRALVVQLINRLEEGLPLAEAIEQTPELLSDQQTLAIRLASQSGTLPETLERLLQRQDSTLTTDYALEGNVPYYLTLGFVMCLIIAVIKALILPTFSEMYEDFGLPVTTSFGWLNSPWADALVVLIPTLLLITFFLSWLSQRFGLTRQFRHLMGSFVSARQYRESQANTLQILSEVMLGGRPAAGVLATLARFHFDSRVRTQLLYAKNEIDLGANLADSFGKVDLLSANQAAALDMLETNADQGWLLSKISQRRIAKIKTQRGLLATLIHPVVIGLFGLVTLLVCSAVLTMLLRMITSLS